MHLDWLAWWQTWSSPVAIWWCCLTIVSALNITLWFKLVAIWSRTAPRGAAAVSPGILAIEPLLLLAALYVFGCAFRSVLPRADVQRICLFDTWLSSVMIGRSVATVAELCFAAQWAIVLRELGRVSHSDTTKNIAGAVVPLIVLAECCSWFAVISTDFLGNVLENSIWAVAFSLIGVALIRLLFSFRGPARIAIAAAAVGVAFYVLFMAAIDVPMLFLSAGMPISKAASRCSASSPAFTISRRIGWSRIVSRHGTTRSRGCRSISASRSG